MYPVYFFLSYLLLALAIPLGLALIPVWRRARTARCVQCPDALCDATVSLDPRYAVRMHALGEREPRVASCSQWPGRSGCGQECLVQIGAAV